MKQSCLFPVWKLLGVQEQRCQHCVDWQRPADCRLLSFPLPWSHCFLCSAFRELQPGWLEAGGLSLSSRGCPLLPALCQVSVERV